MRALIAAAAVAALAGTLQAQPISLETLLGEPFPSSATAGAQGGWVAWVENRRGVRNVRIAGPPSFEPRTLTSYLDDDGQELGELTFTPDGETLLFVRGGEPNGRGENPNPISAPDGVDRAVWAVSVSGGEPRRIGSGHAPTPLSGAETLLVDGGMILRASLDGSGKPEALFAMRGAAVGLRLSPDREKLAFVSRRGSHSFVGVFDFKAREIQWMDPGLDHDAAPVWSPDSDRVAFLRIPSDPALARFGPRRSGPPWSIRVADPETGQGEEVWRADEGGGSVFQALDQGDNLWWTADGRLVFVWEKGGRLRLWSVDAAGGDLRLLTPGEHDVEHAAATADGRGIAYATNLDAPERRRLFRVSARGDEPEPLTSASGIAWSPAPSSDGEHLLYFRSDARTPARAALLDIDSKQARDLAARTLPSEFSRLVEPRPVSFPAADGMEIRGQLFLPTAAKNDGSHPAVVFFHGGSRRQMLLGWHNRDYYHNAYALNQHLASKGYVVLSVNYRGGTGYGMEFRETDGFGAAGGSEYADVVGAGMYLRSRPEVDPARIGLWGGSYGGYLTAMGLARGSAMFAAGVDLHGVHDWSTELEPYRIAREEDPDRDERFRIAFESSPMAFVDQWRSPVLLIHGDDDRNVQFTQTSVLLQKLRRQGVETELLVFPDEVHGFLTYRRWLQALTAAAGFFDRRLASPQ